MLGIVLMMREDRPMWDNALALSGTCVDIATLAPLRQSLPSVGKSRPTQPILLMMAQVAGVQLGLRKSCVEGIPQEIVYSIPVSSLAQTPCRAHQTSLWGSGCSLREFLLSQGADFCLEDDSYC